jgi:hypothetical protein
MYFTFLLRPIGVPWAHNVVEDFRSNDNEISASDIVAAENLRPNMLSVTQKLFNELCWPLWQSDDEFPAEFLNRYLGDSLAAIGLR